MFAPYLTRHSYAIYILVLRYLVLLVFVATAFLVFWRRSHDWIGLLISTTLVILPVGFNLAGYTNYWQALFDPPWD